MTYNVFGGTLNLAQLNSTHIVNVGYVHKFGVVKIRQCSWNLVSCYNTL